MSVPSKFVGLIAKGSTPEWTRIPYKHITESVTIYVSVTGSDSSGDGTSGNPLATVNAAMALLKDATIDQTAMVTITIQAGHYTNWEQQVLYHPYSQRIAIYGVSESIDISGSLGTRGGSAGAWTLVIPTSNTKNMVVDDYILITSATGTNAYGMLGCHKITAVTTNTNFTVEIKNYTCPTGVTVTGSASCLRTVITFSASQHGFNFYSTPGGITVGYMALVGATTNYYAAIFTQSHSRASILAVGAANWDIGCILMHNSFVYLGSCGLSKCDYSIISQLGSCINSVSCIFGGLYVGAQVVYSSFFNPESCCFIQEGSGKTGWALDIEYQSCAAGSNNIAYDWSIGAYASSESSVFMWTYVATTCTTACSPTDGTEGNANSYINVT